MITLILAPPRAGKTVLAALMAHASGGDVEIVSSEGHQTQRALETIRGEHQLETPLDPTGAMIVDTFGGWLDRRGGSLNSFRDVEDGIEELKRKANGKILILTVRSIAPNALPKIHPMLIALADNVISISPGEGTSRHCLAIKCRDKETPFSFAFDVRFVTDDEGRNRPYAVMDKF